MSKTRSMYAGSSGSNYNVNKNSPGNGNGKWQGLPPITNMRSHLIPYTNTRARGNNRNVVFCMNQLGGVGKISNMYATTADGIVDCQDNQVIKHGGTYIPPTGGNLTGEFDNLFISRNPQPKEIVIYEDSFGKEEKVWILTLSPKHQIGFLPQGLFFPLVNSGSQTKSKEYNGFVNYYYAGIEGSRHAFDSKLASENNLGPDTKPQIPTQMTQTPLYKTGISLVTKEGILIDSNNDVSVKEFEWYVLPEIGDEKNPPPPAANKLWQVTREGDEGTSLIARVIRNDSSSPYPISRAVGNDSPGLIAEYDTSFLVLDVTKLSNIDDHQAHVQALIQAKDDKLIEKRLATLLQKGSTSEKPWYKAFGPISTLYQLIEQYGKSVLVITNSNGSIPNNLENNAVIDFENKDTPRCPAAPSPGFPAQRSIVDCDPPTWDINSVGSLLPNVPSSNVPEGAGGVDWPFWPAEQGAFYWKTKPNHDDKVWLVPASTADNLPMLSDWRLIGTVARFFGLIPGVFPVWPDV